MAAEMTSTRRSFLEREDVVGAGMDVRVIDFSRVAWTLLYCQALIVDAIVKFLVLVG